MRRVLVALLPAALVYISFFGPGLIVNLAIAVVAALCAEALVLRARGRDAGPALADGSAAVTAVLLAFALPPLAPWWLPALGAATAIVLAKHLYGGLGANLFNPAMVGYVVLLVSFPTEMTQWLPPGDTAVLNLSLTGHLAYVVTGQLPSGLTVDAITQATPLDQIREGLGEMQTLAEIQIGQLYGRFGGRGWEWINAAAALGGIYLLIRGVIRWHIPTAMLAAIVFCAVFLNALDPSRFLTPTYHLCSGSTMLAAFFIATDPVTAATTAKGRLIYGAGIGVITFSIRTWGGYPDGIAFAILLMNSTVPLLDRYTRPRIYGRG
ncbi:MAG TPA: RnfABCDGE type electron transport complex subunit D [Gammaproteobacteria bacterium]